MKKKYITGGDALMESLIAEGVEVIFGYPGGAIMPTYDALYRYQDRLRHILVRHEQGAGHAAEGYARASGKVGVVLVTSGPGATNIVTPLADAMLDSVPLVCITGQVASPFLGTDAFQEVDVIGITTPVTKWNYQVTKAAEVPEIMAKAFFIARSGRPGPVVIDFTKDAQSELMEFSYKKDVHMPGYHPHKSPHPMQLAAAAKLLNEAERPYMLVGHGVIIANAQQAVLDLVKKADLPVAATLLGLSTIPSGHKNNAGMLGMHGNYGANMLTNKADVILAVGMRFDDRVTGRLNNYAPQAKIIHIDIDPAEINKIVPVDVPIVADAKNALEQLLPLVKRATHPDWIAMFQKKAQEEYAKVTIPEIAPRKDKSLCMSHVIHTLSHMTKGLATVVSDVGQHQMLSARYYAFQKPNTYITSGGAGTMGYALPAALGVKVATLDQDVIAIIGDGSFQMNIQELATIAQEKLPVKIMILNNGFLGMVRQWQELFFEKRYSFVHMQNPDFVKVAKGFGIAGEDVFDATELEKALTRMLKAQTPYLLNIRVQKEVNIFPMMPPGASVDEIRLS